MPTREQGENGDDGAADEDDLYGAVLREVDMADEGNADECAPAVQAVLDSPQFVALSRRLLQNCARQSAWASYARVLQRALLHLVQCLGDQADSRDAEEDAGRIELLVQFAEAICAEMTQARAAPETLKMLADWQAQITDAAVQIADRCAEDDEQAALALVQMASAVFAVGKSDQQQLKDLRSITFCWKNMKKLVIAHGARLLCEQSPPSSSQNVDADDTSAAVSAFSPLQVYTSLLAYTAAVAQAIQHAPQQEDGRPIGHLIKMLRVYWRAFDGLFLCWAEALGAQVESSIAMVLDVAAALVPLVDAHPPYRAMLTDRIQHEAWRILQALLDWVQGVATSDQLQASTRAHLQMLLWQPSASVNTLVATSRAQYVEQFADGIAEQAGYQDMLLGWSHQLVLSAFAASLVDVDLTNITDQDQDVCGSNNFESQPLKAIIALLQRYQQWATQAGISDIVVSRSRWVDHLLAILSKNTDPRELQFFLLAQSLKAEPSLRFVVFELWREVVCEWWPDELALPLLQTVLQLAGSPRAIADEKRHQLVQLVAFLFADCSEALQRVCLSPITTVLDQILDQGPTFQPSSTSTMQFELLEALGAASFLTDCRLADKETWIATYLPHALECIQTAHDMLVSAPASGATSVLVATGPSPIGMQRVLDASWLVVRAVVADEGRGQVQELAALLIPLAIDSLRAFAQAAPRMRPKGQQDSVAIVTRVLASCLEVLSTLAPQLKCNAQGHCVRLLHVLVRLVELQPRVEQRVVLVLHFVRSELADLQVAASDAVVVAAMLRRLWHKLTALSFGLALIPHTPWTPAQAQCLHALVAMLSSASVPEQTGVGGWIAPQAKPHVLRFIEGLSEIDLDPVTATTRRRRENHLHSTNDASGTGKQMYDLPPRHGSKRDRETPVSMSQQQPTMQQQQKRVKWDRVAMLCRALQNAELPDVSELELDDAAAALERLAQRLALGGREDAADPSP